MRTRTARLTACLALALAPGAARAAGLLVPAQGGTPLAIASQDVDIDVFDGLATTIITQEFRNDGPDPLEAVYSFPLPPGASLTGFTAWIAGREMSGEVLPRKVAREHYQAIVHPQIEPSRLSRPSRLSIMEGIVDPGLIEEITPQEFRVTIFPVPARGLQKIRVSYCEQLAVSRDEMRLVHALETRREERSQVEGPLEIRLAVRSSVPIADFDFPGTWSESVSAEQSSPQRLTATMTRASGGLDDDFVATWRLERESAGLDVLTFREPGEDGTFLLFASAPLDEAASPAPIAWTIMVDVSGSMQRRRRIDIAAEAVGRFLAGCPEGDLVNVIAFNVKPIAFAASPQPNDERTRAEVSAWLRARAAIGGTSLVPALELACELRARDRENALVIVSDGGLGDGDLSHAPALDIVRGCGPRVFGLALGNDANAPILQALADASGGFTARVSTREDLLARGALLRERLRTRPWRKLKLEAPRDAGLFDLAPGTIPDLWPGEQIMVAGRFRGDGATRFVLRGERDGKETTLEAWVDLPREAGDFPEIRRAWAESRVTDLEQAMRAGSAAADAPLRIEELGVKHSIVTSLTSFLVLENDAMYEERGIERRSHALLEAEEQARAQRNRRADAAPVIPMTQPERKARSSFGSGALGGIEALLLAAWAGLVLLARRFRR